MSVAGCGFQFGLVEHLGDHVVAALKTFDKRLVNLRTVYVADGAKYGLASMERNDFLVAHIDDPFQFLLADTLSTIGSFQCLGTSQRVVILLRLFRFNRFARLVRDGGDLRKDNPF